MATVRSNNHEPLESMLRKFKKKVVKEGIMEDMKKKEFYKKPSIKKKEKSETARKLAEKSTKKFK
jgi:small subunit ribosomal protein S21